VALLVIPATQEAEIRRMAVQSQPRQIVHKPLSRKYSSQKGLVEWLKLKALSSSPSTTKKKERKRDLQHTVLGGFSIQDISRRPE
jgi:hypothetical protein